MPESVSVHVEGTIARLTLCRPDRHNAFDDECIRTLTRHIQDLSSCSALLLCAEGKSFSAGADLGWMKRAATYTYEENLKDAQALAELMRVCDQTPAFTIGLIEGAVYGGGVGLVACMDSALCTQEAVFCLSEVKLGLIPSVIAPYVVRAIGHRFARRYFQTAEKITAQEALRMGLVHEVVACPEDRAQEILAGLKVCAPEARPKAKALVHRMDPIEEAMIRETSEGIARLRAGKEATEGLSAFLERRPPQYGGETG